MSINEGLSSYEGDDAEQYERMLAEVQEIETQYTPEQLAQIHAAMEEELGIGRKEKLGLEDGERKHGRSGHNAYGGRGNFNGPVTSYATRMVVPRPPDSADSGNHAALSAWSTHVFTDVSAEEIQMQDIAGGQLHRIKRAEAGIDTPNAMTSTHLHRMNSSRGGHVTRGGRGGNGRPDRKTVLARLRGAAANRIKSRAASGATASRTAPRIISNIAPTTILNYGNSLVDGVDYSASTGGVDGASIAVSGSTSATKSVRASGWGGGTLHASKLADPDAFLAMAQKLFPHSNSGASTPATSATQHNSVSSHKDIQPHSRQPSQSASSTLQAHNTSTKEAPLGPVLDIKVAEDDTRQQELEHTKAMVQLIDLDDVNQDDHLSQFTSATDASHQDLVGLTFERRVAEVKVAEVGSTLGTELKSSKSSGIRKKYCVEELYARRHGDKNIPLSQSTEWYSNLQSIKSSSVIKSVADDSSFHQSSTTPSVVKDVQKHYPDQALKLCENPGAFMRASRAELEPKPAEGIANLVMGTNRPTLKPPPGFENYKKLTAPIVPPGLNIMAPIPPRKGLSSSMYATGTPSPSKSVAKQSPAPEQGMSNTLNFQRFLYEDEHRSFHSSLAQFSEQNNIARFGNTTWTERQDMVATETPASRAAQPIAQTSRPQTELETSAYAAPLQQNVAMNGEIKYKTTRQAGSLSPEHGKSEHIRTQSIGSTSSFKTASSGNSPITPNRDKNTTMISQSAVSGKVVPGAAHTGNLRSSMYANDPDVEPSIETATNRRILSILVEDSSAPSGWRVMTGPEYKHDIHGVASRDASSRNIQGLKGKDTEPVINAQSQISVFHPEVPGGW